LRKRLVQYKKLEKLFHAVNKSAAVLIEGERSGNIVRAVSESLELIGTCIGADRASIWQFDEDADSMIVTLANRWESSGKEFIHSDAPSVFIPQKSVFAFMNAFGDNSCYNGPVSAMLPEARKLLTIGDDVKSTVVIPLYKNAQFRGFISIDDCKEERILSDEEMEFLHSVSLMIANIYNNAELSKTRDNESLRTTQLSNVLSRISRLPSFHTNDIAQFFNPKGGPTLIKTDLPIGEKVPKQAIEITTKIVSALMHYSPQPEIAVLTKQITTVKALQKAMSGNYKNLLIETVNRVQGLTTDITIFVIPNTGLYYSLESRLFNVATSRAKHHTLIITDKETLNSQHSDKEVRGYLQKLDKEFSFYVLADKKAIACSTKMTL